MQSLLSNATLRTKKVTFDISDFLSWTYHEIRKQGSGFEFSSSRSKVEVPLNQPIEPIYPWLVLKENNKKIANINIQIAVIYEKIVSSEQ